MADFLIKSKVKVANGFLFRFSHNSLITKTLMTAAVFVPSNVSNEEKFPSLLYLSGLTCTDENVCQKSGIFQILSELKMGLIAPDTSPRGANIPGETDAWDFGVGAGFYLDATQSPWSTNYNMYSYVTKELIDIVSTHFPAIDTSK